MNGKVLRLSFPVCLLAAGILVVLMSGLWVMEARGQDEGPICPPGFEWQRMSGVGCVQEDCGQMGGRLSYTSACICNEGLKACSEPVDYSNFDQTLCGIHCPGWRLTACVEANALCPGEEAPPEPLVTEAPRDWVDPSLGGSETVSRMEEIILGGDAHPPTPGRATAAAVTGTVMLGLFSLVQGWGEQTKSVLKRGESGIRQPPVKGVVDPPEAPDLRGTAGGLVKDVSAVIDKWPKGGSGDEDVTIRRPAESDSDEEVFYGENARLILIGLVKLPTGTAQSEILLLGRGGFTALSGRHPSGEAQQIRLVSGREILVDEVISVGYEGVPADDAVSVEIDFSRKLTLIARLVDDSEAPTILRRDLDEAQDGEEGEVQP